MLTPSHTIFAVLAAVGVFLFVDALFPRRARVRLAEADTRPAGQRLMDAFFAPAAERVVSIRRGDLAGVKRDLAQKLARASYPPPFLTPENVLAHQLFSAILFAAFGSVVIFAGFGSMTLVVMAGLAALGWFAPLQAIANAERERREQLLLDAASTLDRLASYLAAGNALPAAVRSISERPGGAWVAEFRRVAAAYSTTAGGDFVLALDEIVERSGQLPEIKRVAERLKAAYEMGGGGVAKAMRQMAADARINIRLLITERGYRNAVTMVIPAFFAILAMTMILIAPGGTRMIAVIGG